MLSPHSRRCGDATQLAGAGTSIPAITRLPASTAHLRCTPAVCAVALAGRAAAQASEFFPALQGPPMCPGSVARSLTNLTASSALAPNCQQHFVVTAAALRGTPCDYSNGATDRLVRSQRVVPRLRIPVVFLVALPPVAGASHQPAYAGTL